MKNIGLVVKPDTKANETADKLETWLQTKETAVIRTELAHPDIGPSDSPADSAPPDLFCVFVLGGDGTFLSAARWIGNQDIPMLGVKFGDVGFLAEASEDSLFPLAETILNNDFTTTPRMRLQVKVIRDKEEVACETILNDAVINKGALARLAHIDTYINSNLLTTYKSDGLIVSTPTGSTAYSLAAGGPIIHPEVPGIIMTPICPFTLTNRPLILPDTASIEIRFAEKSSDIMLTFDGQKGFELNDDDRITVKKGDHPISMINVPKLHYFDILKTLNTYMKTERVEHLTTSSFGQKRNIN